MCGVGLGGNAVENYTTSINHFFTTVFLSPSISRFRHLRPCFLLPSLLHGHASLFLICTPTTPHPDGPWLSALYPSFSPWPCSLLKSCWSPSLRHSPSISNSFPLWFVYMLCLLICFLLPTRDLSPVHETVLRNLEINFFL